MTAVGLGQQRSQAVGLVFESLTCQIFLRFTLSIFWCPELMKHWRVPLRCFSALWEKKFRGKTWYSPPPPIHKLFGYRKFSETQHRRLPVRNFSALWDKKISTENLDTPPPPPLIQTFSIPEINATVKDSPTEIFGTVRQKNFRRNGKILILPPPLLSTNFFATGNFLKHSAESFNYEIFRHCETKGFRRKILILPPPLISFFATENFLKHSTDGFNYEIIRQWDKKYSTENLDTTPRLSLLFKLFRYPKLMQQ